MKKVFFLFSILFLSIVMYAEEGDIADKISGMLTGGMPQIATGLNVSSNRGGFIVKEDGVYFCNGSTGKLLKAPLDLSTSLSEIEMDSLTNGYYMDVDDAGHIVIYEWVIAAGLNHMSTDVAHVYDSSFNQIRVDTLRINGRCDMPTLVGNMVEGRGAYFTASNSATSVLRHNVVDGVLTSIDTIPAPVTHGYNSSIAPIDVDHFYVQSRGNALYFVDMSSTTPAVTNLTYFSPSTFTATTGGKVFSVTGHTFYVMGTYKVGGYLGSFAVFDITDSENVYQIAADSTTITSNSTLGMNTCVTFRVVVERGKAIIYEYAAYNVRKYELIINPTQVAVLCDERYGLVSGGGIYAQHSNAEISATPSYGYHFIHWSDGNTDNPRTVEITQDTTFTAEFAPNQYAVSLQGDEERGLVEGAGTFDYLTQITLSATPAYGYHFSSWSDGNMENPRVYTVTRDITLTANFVPNRYMIYGSCQAEQGSIAGIGSYDYLTECSIEAVPSYGYHFVQWSDGITINPRTIVLTKDTSFTAEFAPNQYTLSMQCDNEFGTVDGAGVYDYLTQINLTATPVYGYHFSSWSDGNTENPRTYTVTQDITLTANFAHNVYSLNVTCQNEQGQVTGNGSYYYLSSRTIEAISNYGYHFAQWSDGNTDNPRVIELISDTTFVAEFAIDKSGVCGDDNLLTWNFDSDSKTLAISGEGSLGSNYTFGLEAPTQTEKLIIAEGVSAIGQSAFTDMCATITSLALPSTLTSIADYAFAGLSNRKFNTLVLPNTIVSIGAHVFDGASYLQTIHFGSTLEEIGEYAFNGCVRVQKMTCLAEITPNVGTDGLTSISSLAKLYVPNDYLFEYQIDDNWNRFQLMTLGAETTTTDSVSVTPTENTADVKWPAIENAATYELEIKDKNGNIICTLIFNSNGQLTSIAFAAPSRTQTSGQIAGFSFTVTGLDSGTGYDLTITAKDDQGEVLNTATQSFTTTGDITTDAGLVQSSDMHGGQKILRDGHLLILRDGKTYTIHGQEM